MNYSCQKVFRILCFHSTRWMCESLIFSNKPGRLVEKDSEVQIMKRKKIRKGGKVRLLLCI